MNARRPKLLLEAGPVLAAALARENLIARQTRLLRRLYRALSDSWGNCAFCQVDFDDSGRPCKPVLRRGRAVQVLASHRKDCLFPALAAAVRPPAKRGRKSRRRSAGNGGSHGTGR